uniref:p12-15p n=1 Tax=Pyrococcus sp. 12/1 TaxID=758582 RepID=D6MY21_9EURY|nr:ribbon-helix-helix domain-containing protein [Pyrococcus sp. 12/1]ADF80222.1 p12-15p [Pyrococcus sp. 12/1]
MPAETSKTKIISIRMPKEYLLVADALIEAGFFRNRTELTIAAYHELIRKFAPLIYAYLKTKEKYGVPSSPEEFGKFFVDFIDKTVEVVSKTAPEDITDSFYFIVAAKLWDLDRHSPEVLEKLVKAYEDLRSKRITQNSPRPGVHPHAGHSKTQADSSSDGESSTTNSGGESPTDKAGVSP